MFRNQRLGRQKCPPSKWLVSAAVLILAGCAAPQTENYWEPIDPGQLPYFSQVSAQCQIYARNVAAGINMPTVAGPNSGNSAMQALLGGIYVGLSADDAFSECMLASGWQLKTRLTAAGVSTQYFERAVTSYKNKQWSDLEIVARQWISAQPKNFSAYEFYGLAYANQGNPTAAIAHFDQSIAIVCMFNHERDELYTHKPNQALFRGNTNYNETTIVSITVLIIALIQVSLI